MSFEDSMNRMQQTAGAALEEKKRARRELWARIQSADPGMAEFIQDMHKIFNTTLIKYRDSEGEVRL